MIVPRDPHPETPPVLKLVEDRCTVYPDLAAAIDRDKLRDAVVRLIAKRVTDQIKEDRRA